MRRDDAIYLLDMLLAARDAMEFACRLTFSQFAQSRLDQLAILKSIEIVGEAASHLSADTRNEHPGIPWREIIGMRNRLVHVYFDIDLRLVWDTVQNDLPALIVQLEPLVPPEPDFPQESE